MTPLEKSLHTLDCIGADLHATVEDAAEHCRTDDDWKKLDENLAVTAHWMANVRQGVILRREMARRRSASLIDTTGGS